jgi:cytochrome c peroxidase
LQAGAPPPPLNPNYGFDPDSQDWNTDYPKPTGFVEPNDSEKYFQFGDVLPYSTTNPFDAADLEAFQRGFDLFMTEEFNGNGRTCGTCHLPDKNYNIARKDFQSLPHAAKLLVLGGSNPDLENEEAVADMLLFNINLGAGPGTEGNIADPDGPFRSSMTIGGVGFTTLNNHVCIDGALTPGGTPCPFAFPPPGNRAVDDGIRDIMIGWSGEGPLAEPFTFIDAFGNEQDDADCDDIIADFAADRSSLRDLDLGLATFALAAVKTHLTKTQNREPGVDFICPTQAQLLDMADFQKWLGRRFELDITQLTFTAPQARLGRNLFSTRQATCVACHVNAGASDTQGRVKSTQVPFLHTDGTADFEYIPTHEILPIIGTNKTSRNGSQALETEIFEQLHTFDFPFDPGDHQLRSGPLGLGPRQGGFNVQSIIEAVRNKQFFHNNGVVGPIENAIEFYFTDDFKASQGGNAISGDFRLDETETDELTPAQAREFLGGDAAIDSMGYFLRALSSLYAIMDCQRLVDEMLFRIDEGMTIDLPSSHCRFALNDANTMLKGAKVKPNPYKKLTAAINGVKGKLNGLSTKYNNASKKGKDGKKKKVKDKVVTGLEKLAGELEVIRKAIATTPELGDS